MKITLLGGAKEVGASCLLVEAGKTLLIDCGVRVNEQGTDMLPNLEPLNNIVPDAILVSHAHLDHCGALPVVSKLFPGVLIHTTPPTKDLMRVLLYDAIKVAEFKEGLKLYDEDEAEKTLDKTVTHGFGVSFEVADGIVAQFLPAGHILGAASILLQTNDGTLIYTGDFTTFEQETVGMQGFNQGLTRGVDVVITEGTYGSRLHGNRAQEVARLLDAVTQTIDNGGRVLIPAFAVGRAQEIILSLRNHMRRTKQKMAVYVDGLVRNVNSVFSRNPNYLARRYRNEVLKGYEMFYTEGIRPVESRALRDRILESSEPCVIIASSGMLMGGVSPVYAEKLISGEKNLLAIVGYQDEESPGRKLLELATLPPEERKIVLNDTELKVNCQVSRFGLSAHADKLGITSSVKGLKPGLVLINHGSDEALEGLAESLAAELPDARIEIAESLQPYEFVSTPSARRVYALKPGISGISLWKDEPLDSGRIVELWKHLLANNLGRTTLTIRDLLTVWHGPRQASEEEMRGFRNAIISDPHFRVSATNPNTAYVLTEAEYQEAMSPKPMEQNAAKALAEQKLANYGLQKVGFSSDGTIVLYFPTSKYAERCRDVIAEVSNETLRPVEVSQVPNTQFIKDRLKRELLEKFSVLLDRDPSVGAESVVVRLPQGTPPDLCTGDSAPLVEYSKQFAEETGIEVEFRWPSGQGKAQATPSQAIAVCHGPEGNFFQVSTNRKHPSGRLEQNLAKNLVESAFRHEPHQPRVGIYAQEGRMVFSFITPQIGKRYASLIAKLSEETGWTIEISSNVRTNEIAELARNLLLNHNIRGVRVGVFDGFVEVRGAVVLEASVVNSLEEKFRELTGFEMKFRKTG